MRPKEALFMVSLGAAAFLSCGMGGVFEHREELGTLKEQADEEGAKAKELAEQDASFQAVRAAVAGGELKAGAARKNVSRKYGGPSVITPKNGGEEWMYVARSKKWLETPRVVLRFGREGTLEGWECAHADCGGG